MSTLTNVVTAAVCWAVAAALLPTLALTDDHSAAHERALRMRQLRRVSQQILRARSQHRESFKADLAPTMQAIETLRVASRNFADHLRVVASRRWLSASALRTPSAPTSPADGDALLQAVRDALTDFRESRVTLEDKLQARRQLLSSGATTSARSSPTIDRTQVDVQVLSRIETKAEAATAAEITDAQRLSRLNGLVAELRPGRPDDLVRYDHAPAFAFDAPSP